MQKKVIFIYDDSIEPPFSIKSIVGERSFGEIIYKRKKLKDRLLELVTNCGIRNIIEITSINQRIELINKMKESSNEVIFIHFLSQAVIIDNSKFETILNKASYFQSSSMNQELNPYMSIFTNIMEYEMYINGINQNEMITKSDFGENILIFAPQNFALDITDIASFLNFFSGGFEARYFNELVGDKYTLTKKSVDINKMKKEYNYYHLLPDVMKKWYVMPYDLKMESDRASYTMERLNVPDMALQWIHNSMEVHDFKIFLEKIFTFIVSRPSKDISKTDYEERFNNLYLHKIHDRLEILKNQEPYNQIASLIINGTKHTIEEILEDYKQIFEQLKKELVKSNEVIGHGDLCFSNILYDKNTYLMKFIDTKGALEESDLWTDPYYDLAKLSHSILGNYDFINNELFTLTLDNDLALQLTLSSKKNNTHQRMFIEKVEEAGYNIRFVRLCEISLFLSMLPLHIDNPRKVLAYLINAIIIKEELKNNV